MGLKEQIVELCEQVIKDNVEAMVRLPAAPMSWSKKRKDARFHQLQRLIKKQGCSIMKLDQNNLYSIIPLPKETLETPQVV